jgi:hypothetical protein
LSGSGALFAHHAISICRQRRTKFVDNATIPPSRQEIDTGSNRERISPMSNTLTVKTDVGDVEVRESELASISMTQIIRKVTSQSFQSGLFGMAKLKPAAVYLLLLAVQTTGALFFISKELPDFRQILLYPGEQLPYLRGDDFAMMVAIVAMQVAYWYRLQRVPIPFQGSNTILSHLLLFLGRLSFVFGGSLFAVVFFRHIPGLDQSTDTWLMARRGLLLAGSLFALFCFALELERFGAALGSTKSD